MFSPIRQYIREAFPSKKKNILTFATHERYQELQCDTWHNFYALRGNEFTNIKQDWNVNYAKQPSNFKFVTLEDITNGHVMVDLLLSQHKYGQYQALRNIQKVLNVPLISMEHTLPTSVLKPEEIMSINNLRGNVNIFLSNYSVDSWGWDRKTDTVIINPAIDTDVFVPQSKQRQAKILCVVNDWINRGYCCGWDLFSRLRNDYPFTIKGSTKGLSEPTKDIGELVNHYNTHSIFLNTSNQSTCPFTLLEAAACEMAIVSTATSMIPEIIENGVNGWCTNNETEMRNVLDDLLINPNKAREWGKNARQTILNKLSKESFLSSWNQIFTREYQWTLHQ